VNNIEQEDKSAHNSATLISYWALLILQPIHLFLQ